MGKTDVCMCMRERERKGRRGKEGEEGERDGERKENIYE